MLTLTYERAHISFSSEVNSIDPATSGVNVEFQDFSPLNFLFIHLQWVRRGLSGVEITSENHRDSIMIE